jgi:hypothetical protein
MTVVTKKVDSQNISYTLAQLVSDKFAIIVRDEDANELVSRIEGEEALMRDKYEVLTTKANRAA